MTNSKYSNDQTTDIVARSQGFDEGYAAGIKEGISMALEALPEKMQQEPHDTKAVDAQRIYWNDAIDQATDALLKLKKG